MNMVGSRPILSDSQPKKGRAIPFKMLSMMPAITSVVPAMPRNTTCVLSSPKSRAIGPSCAVAAGGPMATAQPGPIARDFGLDKTQVVFLGIAGTTLIMAGIIDNILNGIARPFFGWLSDNIGREPTMFIAFGGGALAMWGLTSVGRQPLAFVP